MSYDKINKIKASDLQYVTSEQLNNWEIMIRAKANVFVIICFLVWAYALLSIIMTNLQVML